MKLDQLAKAEAALEQERLKFARLTKQHLEKVAKLKKRIVQLMVQHESIHK